MKKNINIDDTSLKVYLIHYLAVLIIKGNVLLTTDSTIFQAQKGF